MPSATNSAAPNSASVALRCAMVERNVRQLERAFKATRRCASDSWYFARSIAAEACFPLARDAGVTKIGDVKTSSPLISNLSFIVPLPWLSVADKEKLTFGRTCFARISKSALAALTSKVATSISG